MLTCYSYPIMLCRSRIYQSIHTATRPFSNFNISYPSKSHKVFVFMSGSPGSGKTHALHKIYDLANVMILDLDNVIKLHPHYKGKNRAAVYQEKPAYEWANNKIEDEFQAILTSPQKLENRLYALDGTGANHERTIRRMREAKAAGFWVVLLYVKVLEETAQRRNAARKRVVPHEVISHYVQILDKSVGKVLSQNHLVDEYITLNNDEDDQLSELERWGRFQARIEEENRERNDFTDFMGW